MHGWIIVLIVLGALLLLPIVLLLCGRARIRITLNGKLRISIKVLFFRKQLLPGVQEGLSDPSECKDPEKLLQKEEKRRRKIMEKAEKKRKAKPRPDQEKKPETPAPAPNLTENLNMIFDFIKKTYAYTRKRIGIRFYRMHLLIATGDAANTAIAYGITVQTVSLLLDWINSHYNRIRRDPGDLWIKPDFVGDTTRADVDLELSVGLMSAIVIAYRVRNAWKSERAARDRKAAARMKKKARRAA